MMSIIALDHSLNADDAGLSLRMRIASDDPDAIEWAQSAESYIKSREANEARARQRGAHAKEDIATQIEKQV